MDQLRDRLERQVRRGVVGREQELDLLSKCLGPDGPVVAFVHGIPGIGKSALLQAFASRAREAGTRVLRVDGESVEPSEPGFLHRLGQGMGVPGHALPAVLDEFSRIEGPFVLAVDTYERLRLLDSWLRRTFVPALPDNARLVVASRYPPSSRWFTRPGWQDLVFPLKLGPLSDDVALELLGRMGLDESQARRIQDFARGHPLALQLAAVTFLQEGDRGVGDAGAAQVVHELSRRVLDGVDDPATREALVAASAVRRTTVSLLSAIFPERDGRSLHARLAELPFVYSGPDGLVVHEAVRDAIAADTRAQDPDRHRRYRRAAWEQLQAEADDAGRSELWRYTADMLYLIENPICREAFFPSGAQELTVEPAADEHADEVLEIAERHEGREAVDLLRYWWRVRWQRFRVVVDPGGSIVGFYFMLPADEARAAPQDPVATRWLERLSRRGWEPSETLFIRRWLSLADGESPCAVQAACWLDIKRAYMAMRPRLRCVYLTARELGPYAEAAEAMGFERAPELDRAVGEDVYRTARLDLGPDSVDGWLRGLAAKELGIEPETREILDRSSHQMVVGEDRVPLSPREFDVLDHLDRELGKAVSRRELLDAVWDDADVSSNVVDRAVYSLRRKLGDEEDRLETVRGFGYRLRRN